MKNIFVGNLDITTTEDQIRELFRPHGTIATVTLVNDRDTGSPRGFAFVEMTDDQEADAAIKGLDGTVLEGRALAVNEARAKAHGTTIDAAERRKQEREPLEQRRHREHRY